MNTSALIFVVGMATYLVLIGLSFFGQLPFAFESAGKLAFILMLLVVILGVEVFKEEKIRNLKDLTNKPLAMGETLFMLVALSQVFMLVVHETIPESMKPILGLTCIFGGILIVVETRD